MFFCKVFYTSIRKIDKYMILLNKKIKKSIVLLGYSIPLGFYIKLLNPITFLIVLVIYDDVFKKY